MRRDAGEHGEQATGNGKPHGADERAARDGNPYDDNDEPTFVAPIITGSPGEPHTPAPPPSGEPDHPGDDAPPLDDASPTAPDAGGGDAAGDPLRDSPDELDGLRIRQVAALRRGAFRARSYALIVAVACVVVAVQLAFMTVERSRTHGWGVLPTGYVMFAVVLLAVGSHFGRRVRELTRELQTPAPLPPPPAGGPDFSTLSDGSQQWKNLEELQDDDRRPEYPGPF